MLSYEILGSIACDGDQKASEAIMENVKTDIAGISCFAPLDWVGNNGEVVYAALDALNSLTGSFYDMSIQTFPFDELLNTRDIFFFCTWF